MPEAQLFALTLFVGFFSVSLADCAVHRWLQISLPPHILILYDPDCLLHRVGKMCLYPLLLNLGRPL